MPADADISDLVWAHEAAKRLGISRERFRRLAIAHGIAVHFAGSARRPFIKVKMSDAARIVLNQKVPMPHGAARPIEARDYTGVRC